MNVDFVRDALRQLGIRRFVLGVHASAFPLGGPEECDVGHGAPLSAAGRRLLAFAAQLGFNAIQLGPSGQITAHNLSPYDGTVFARNTWSLGLDALACEEYGRLLAPEAAASLAQPPQREPRVQPEQAARATSAALELAHARLCQLRSTTPQHPLLRAFEHFRSQHADWLPLDALYAGLAERAGDDPTLFDPGLQSLFELGPVGQQRRAAMRATLGPAIERCELAQYLCHAQHGDFRAQARELGLALWGDMQVGFSHRDRFLHRASFARHWRLGAPPSRTNPHGQPWGYPLLDPDQLEDPSSSARCLFERRVRKLLAEHDGVRIDHPHGLVCPWIYSTSDPDPYHAVRHGARAFESPDHPAEDLRRWAIASAEDLDPAAHSHFADNWVRQLSAAQVERYARLFDVLASMLGPGTRVSDAFAAEVLSTCPYPLRAVLARHGLGRFRVSQKADASNVHDVYRTEHAEPDDWLMLGTHDTPPIYPLATRWLKDRSAAERAAYLAERLITDASQRSAAAAHFASSERNLLCASLADLFQSRAQNVYVFVFDLFGDETPYNRAGIAHPDNWRARLPRDFEAAYSQRLATGRALDIVAALRLAIERKLPTSQLA